EARPRDQISQRRELRHVDSYLPEQRWNADLVAQSGNEPEPGDELPKGLHRLGDPIVELGDGGLESLDELQVHAQQAPLLLRRLALKSFYKLDTAGPQPRVGECSQSLRIGLAGNQSLQDRTAAHPESVRDQAGDLDVGHIEDLLDALDMSVDLTHELLSCTCEFAHGIDLRRGDEAALDQPVSVKIYDTTGILDVCHTVADQPAAQRRQLVRRRAIRPALTTHAPSILDTHRGDQHVFAKIQRGASGVNDLH